MAASVAALELPTERSEACWGDGELNTPRRPTSAAVLPCVEAPFAEEDYTEWKARAAALHARSGDAVAGVATAGVPLFRWRSARRAGALPARATPRATAWALYAAAARASCWRARRPACRLACRFLRLLGGDFARLTFLRALGRAAQTRYPSVLEHWAEFEASTAGKRIAVFSDYDGPQRTRAARRQHAREESTPAAAAARKASRALPAASSHARPPARLAHPARHADAHR